MQSTNNCGPTTRAGPLHADNDVDGVPHLVPAMNQSPSNGGPCYDAPPEYDEKINRIEGRDDDSSKQTRKQDQSRILGATATTAKTPWFVALTVSLGGLILLLTVVFLGVSDGTTSYRNSSIWNSPPLKRTSWGNTRKGGGGRRSTTRVRRNMDWQSGNSLEEHGRRRRLAILQTIAARSETESLQRPLCWSISEDETGHMHDGGAGSDSESIHEENGGGGDHEEEEDHHMSLSNGTNTTFNTTVSPDDSTTKMGVNGTVGVDDEELHQHDEEPKTEEGEHHEEVDGHASHHSDDYHDVHTIDEDGFNQTSHSHSGDDLDLDIYDLLELFPVHEVGNKVEMREECWDGFDMFVEPPQEDILRVDEYYNFKVRIQVRQQASPIQQQRQRSQQEDLGEEDVMSGVIMPPNHVYVRLLLCDIQRSGICTPYSSTNDATVFHGHGDEGVDKDEGHSDHGHDGGRARADGRNVDADDHEGEGGGHEDHNSDFVSFIIPEPQRTDGRPHHVATSFHTSELSPRVQLITRGSNISEVRLASNGSEVDGYLDQTMEVTIALKILPSHEHLPRTFLVMGHAIVFASTFGDHTHISERIDMATAMPEAILTYQDPDIRTNSLGFQIFLVVSLGAFVAGELFLLFSVIKHRNTKVIQLSQGPVLCIMVVAAIVATASCFLMLPLSDAVCNIGEPLVVISLTLMGCVLVGRIWRIKAVLSPAMRIGSSMGANFANQRTSRLKKMEGAVMNSLTFLSRGGRFCKKEEAPRRGRLKKSVSIAEICFLIAVLLLPQIILQLCIAVLLPAQQGEKLNESLSAGHLVCERRVQWPVYLGYALLAVPFIFTFFLSSVSGNLPTLFNEMHLIVKCGRIVLLVMAIGVPLLVLTNDPSVSPDVQSFLYTVLALSVAMTPCHFIVAHKLLLVWSGENVVVSKLLRSTSNISVESSLRSAVGGNIQLPEAAESGLTGSSADAAANASIENRTDHEEDGDGVERKIVVSFAESMESEPSSTDIRKRQPNEDSGVTFVNVAVPADPAEQGRSSKEDGKKNYEARRSLFRLTVDPSEPFPLRLEKRMIGMSQLTTRITERLLCGMQVSTSDLQKLREEGVEFGRVCEGLVIVDHCSDGTEEEAT